MGTIRLDSVGLVAGGATLFTTWDESHAIVLTEGAQLAEFGERRESIEVDETRASTPEDFETRGGYRPRWEATLRAAAAHFGLVMLAADSADVLVAEDGSRLVLGDRGGGCPFTMGYTEPVMVIAQRDGQDADSWELAIGDSLFEAIERWGSGDRDRPRDDEAAGAARVARLSAPLQQERGPVGQGARPSVEQPEGRVSAHVPVADPSGARAPGEAEPRI